MLPLSTETCAQPHNGVGYARLARPPELASEGCHPLLAANGASFPNQLSFFCFLYAFSYMLLRTDIVRAVLLCAQTGASQRKKRQRLGAFSPRGLFSYLKKTARGVFLHKKKDRPRGVLKGYYGNHTGFEGRHATSYTIHMVDDSCLSHTLVRVTLVRKTHLVGFLCLDARSACPRHEYSSGSGYGSMTADPRLSHHDDGQCPPVYRRSRLCTILQPPTTIP